MAIQLKFQGCNSSGPDTAMLLFSRCDWWRSWPQQCSQRATLAEQLWCWVLTILPCWQYLPTRNAYGQWPIENFGEANFPSHLRAMWFGLGCVLWSALNLWLVKRLQPTRSEFSKRPPPGPRGVEAYVSQPLSLSGSRGGWSGEENAGRNSPQDRINRKLKWFKCPEYWMNKWFIYPLPIPNFIQFVSTLDTSKML